jgi:hypothetical protein
MFIILLAQFNSFYNSVLVLLAVVLSTTGRADRACWSWIKAFSIIMTGTGIVALAGIVVNNNIVLIDTYQEYSRYMPRIEAIIRTAEARIRPVLLTTITTMAGLAPMMFGLSLDLQSAAVHHRQPHGAVVEAARDGGGLWTGHRDGADAGVHPVDAGDARLGCDLCALDRPACQAVTGARQQIRAGLGAGARCTQAANNRDPVGGHRTAGPYPTRRNDP